MKPNLEVREFLRGTIFAFFIPSKNIIYVSPAIKSLLETDWEVMKGKLNVMEMPKDKITGEELFADMESWFEAMRQSHSSEIYFQPKVAK